MLRVSERYLTSGLVVWLLSTGIPESTALVEGVEQKIGIFICRKLRLEVSNQSRGKQRMDVDYFDMENWR